MTKQHPATLPPAPSMSRIAASAGLVGVAFSLLGFLAPTALHLF